MDPILWIRRRPALGKTAWIASTSSNSVTCAAVSAPDKLNCRSARPQHYRERRQLRDLPPLVNWKSHQLLKDRPQRKTTRFRGQWAQKITIPQVSEATKIWCTAAVPWRVWPPRKIAHSRSLRTSSLSILLKKWRDVGSKKSRTCFLQLTFLTFHRKAIRIWRTRDNSPRNTPSAAIRPCYKKSTQSEITLTWRTHQ